MIAIVLSDNREDHLATYRDWVSTEWGDDHAFVPPEGSPPLPPPLLALAGDELAGGLSFTWHPAPGTEESALWINTLYVKETHRGKGVARALIEAAEQAARAECVATELLVYTHIHDLYAGNDWESVSQDNDMWVLRKPL